MIISFISITLLTILLLRMNHNERVLLQKTRMDRISMELIGAYFDNRTTDYTEKHGNVTGIIIYEKGGSTLFSYGTITRDPRLYDYSDQQYVHTDKSKSLFLLNYEMERFSRGIPWEARNFMEQDWWNTNIIIHMEIVDEKFFRETQNLYIIQIIIHLFTLLLTIQILILFKRRNQLQKQLDSQQNLVILGSALRTLTHEMKNPLAAIRLHSGFIKRLYPKELEGETAVINSEVDRLSRLMDTVKDYLREPLGDPAPLDTNDFFREIMSLYPDEIQWDLCDTPCPICFDRDRFRSVAENLINNAIESGSSLKDIRIKTSSTKRLVYISISDRGKGIPREIKNHLFDPFFTTKSTGSGAGLMIVKRFLEAAEGQIYIESIEGVMTEIVFRLPKASRGNKQ